MISAPTGLLLQLVRKVAAPPSGSQADEQLLERFVRHRDETAFVALLQRHGPMVLNVCRRVLRHQQDAEDVFQATFLVLARKAGSIRQGRSVGSYLYGVAYHLAVRMRADAARRQAREPREAAMADADPLADMTLREIQQILHEELRQLPEKYRAPLVLCYLEGQTQEEAARQLGWSKRRVKGRLQRGRELLRGRLARRGVALSAGLVATALGVQPSPAAVPAALLSATARAAVATACGLAGTGMVSAPVAALVETACRGLVPARLRLVLVALMTAGALAGAGVLVSARQTAVAPQPPMMVAYGDPERPKKIPAAPAKPEPGERVAVSGRVLDPDGKPVRGARLYLSYQSYDSYLSDTEPPGVRDPRTRTDGDGRFRFTFAKAQVEQPSGKDEPWQSAQVVACAPGYGPAWALAEEVARGELTLRLVRDDVPIDGRILDLQGHPVAGVTVRLAEITTTPGEDLAPTIARLGAWAAGLVMRKATRLRQPAWVGLATAATTDKDGHFHLRGAGRDRLATLRMEGGGIEHGELMVLTRKNVPVLTLRDPRAPTGRQMAIYGATFECAAGPTKPITGTVRERGTGKPLAGVRVATKPPGHWEISTLTDERGHYRLVGSPKLARYHVYAGAPDSPHLPAGQQVSDSEGLKPLAVDFELSRGIAVRCRLIDKETGKPVRGEVRSVPHPDNPFLHEPAGIALEQSMHFTPVADREGVVHLVVPPGPSVLVGTAGGPYLPARVHAADRSGYEPQYGLLYGVSLATVNAYKVIRPDRTTRLVSCDLEVLRGHTLKGSVVDPDGKPLRGVRAEGLTAQWRSSATLSDSAFTAVGLNPLQPRTLTFIQPGRKLAGCFQVRGDERGPVVVRLQRWGEVTGRILDPEGRPLARAQVRAGSLRDQRQLVGSTREKEAPFTDAEGRFRMEGLIPGLEYEIAAGKETAQTVLVARFGKVVLKPGEVKNLGETKARPRD
jgi:RNA polymerase sigma factor (sigma-70 family)